MIDEHPRGLGIKEKEYPGVVINKPILMINNMYPKIAISIIFGI